MRIWRQKFGILSSPIVVVVVVVVVFAFYGNKNNIPGETLGTTE